MLAKKRRLNDLVARVGGEEFVLLLPDIDEINAFELSEKLRKNIANETIENITITVSIGLVVTRKNTKIDFDKLLQLSDDALYNSKKAGRNRTSITLY